MQELLDDALRLPIEQAVTAHIGRPWQVRDYRDLNDLSSHPAAILSDGGYAVFAKLSNAANGFEQFTVEVAGLQRLRQSSGVLTPTQITLLETDQGVIMLQEALQTVERTTRQWQQIGEALACIHCVHGQHFGLETQGYFGPLYQDNRPLDDWATFYAERRLWPRLMSAIDAGHVPSWLIRQLDRLIARLPDLCGPRVAPTLLHGDAQQNNYISSVQGAVVIDPAVYYGHPEMDLAYLDYFQPVPDAVFEGYQTILPIDPGFWQRRDLWRIYGYLAIVTLDVSYLDRLIVCVRNYL